MGVTMHDTMQRRGTAEVQTLGGPSELICLRSSHLSKFTGGRTEIQFSAELWRDILYEHLYTICICPQEKKRLERIYMGVYFWDWDLMVILLYVKKNLFIFHFLFSSVAQTCLTLWPHGLQNARPPCPSPTPRVYPNSGPLSRWWHPTISSSVVPFSSCHQSFPASASFQMSQIFAWGGQSIGVSASASVLPMNNQELISFRMDWLDLLTVQMTLKSLLQHHSSKTSILRRSAFFTVQLSHPYMTARKTITLTR